MRPRDILSAVAPCRWGTGTESLQRLKEGDICFLFASLKLRTGQFRHDISTQHDRFLRGINGRDEHAQSRAELYRACSASRVGSTLSCSTGEKKKKKEGEEKKHAGVKDYFRRVKDNLSRTEVPPETLITWDLRNRIFAFAYANLCFSCFNFFVFAGQIRLHPGLQGLMLAALSHSGPTATGKSARFACVHYDRTASLFLPSTNHAFQTRSSCGSHSRGSWAFCA